MRKIVTMIAIIAVIAIAGFVILTSSGDDKSGGQTGGGSADLEDMQIPASAVEGIEEGNQSPDFSLTLLDGTQVKLSDYKGQIVYLNFWATWCGPCVAEMPDMQKIYEKYSDEIVMLAVNAGGEKHQEVESFMQDNQYTFPAGIDDGQISRQYQVSAIPATYVIDSNGLISTKKIGMMQEKEMQAAVQKALGEKENQ